MKTFVKAVGFAALFVSLSLLSVSGVQAKDEASHLSIKSALEMGKAKGHIKGDINFFFADQSHPAVEATLAKGVVTNKKTNGANKSDEEACNWAMVSALGQLQERARNEGGNAVINIESYYKRKSFRSKDQFECHSGHIMSGVALKGDVVKLKK